MPATILPDYSRYPLYTVVLGIIMGSLVSPFAEESGFRGYFQVVLESRYRAPVAIAAFYRLALVTRSEGRSITATHV